MADEKSADGGFTAVLGPLNGHSIGIILQELIDRAISTIRRERYLFVATDKVSPYKTGWDVVTSADHKAQALILRTLTDCFPGVGIVAEEDELSIPCTLAGVHAFFTVDPLDGTKAFVRRQSHGVGTMIGLVVDERIVSAYVGDVMTHEVYGYRPGSTTVHRTSQREGTETLAVDDTLPLAGQILALRDMPHLLSPLARRLCGPDGPFRQAEVGGGSIGIMLARLWKSEVGAVVLGPGAEAPWDLVPVLGISQLLGFRFLELAGDRIIAMDLRPVREVQRRSGELLIIHASRVPELMSWLERAEASA